MERPNQTQPERCYAPKAIAEALDLSEKTIKRRFADLPGVIKILGPCGTVTLRIPQSVYDRWREQNSQGWQLGDGRRKRGAR